MSIIIHAANTNLHPNMYLLIRSYCYSNAFLNFLFTSQHVSINSALSGRFTHCRRYLHPNMYLLILIIMQAAIIHLKFTSQHVSINSMIIPLPAAQEADLHPNMYLLIPRVPFLTYEERQDLHPNMYLLIPTITGRTQTAIYIYIPTCIY